MAGIGSPMNEEVWRSSTLKRARRNAPQTAMNIAAGAMAAVSGEAFMHWKAIIAGATPKLTRSHSESSSFPIGE